MHSSGPGMISHHSLGNVPCCQRKHSSQKKPPPPKRNSKVLTVFPLSNRHSKLLCKPPPASPDTATPTAHLTKLSRARSSTSLIDLTASLTWTHAGRKSGICPAKCCRTVCSRSRCTRASPCTWTACGGITTITERKVRSKLSPWR